VSVRRALTSLSGVKARFTPWLAVACLLSGVVLLVVPGPARAETGAELGSFDLLARAPGIDVLFDTQQSPAHPAGQAVFPETTSSLQTGPIGFGFASMGWPGPLAGNLGSLLLIAGGVPVPVPLPVPPPTLPPPPPGVTALNDPVRAESHSPGGPPDAHFSQPGIALASHADDRHVSATGSMDKTEVPGVFGVGHVDGASTSDLAAGKGLAASTSTVSGFSVGPAGVLKIDSVVSVARATTDGTVATGEGHTVVSGVTVAGQPAWIDETGLHFGQQGQPNPIAPVANQVGATALQQAGITVSVSQPQVVRKGATAQFVAGSVIVDWVPPHGQGTVTTFALGGASASVAASPAFGTADQSLLPAAGSPGTGATVNPAVGGTGGTGGGSGPLPLPPPTGPATTGTGTGDGSGPQPVALAATPAAHFHGVAPGLVVMAIGVALLLAGPMRRLADDVLSQPASSCNLDGGPS
jgi:hypothetical protein